MDQEKLRGTRKGRERGGREIDKSEQRSRERKKNIGKQDDKKGQGAGQRGITGQRDRSENVVRNNRMGSGQKS